MHNCYKSWIAFIIKPVFNKAFRNGFFQEVKNCISSDNRKKTACNFYSDVHLCNQYHEIANVYNCAHATVVTSKHLSSTVTNVQVDWENAFKFYLQRKMHEKKSTFVLAMCPNSFFFVCFIGSSFILFLRKQWQTTTTLYEINKPGQVDSQDTQIKNYTINTEEENVGFCKPNLPHPQKTKAIADQRRRELKVQEN